MRRRGPLLVGWVVIALPMLVLTPWTDTLAQLSLTSLAETQRGRVPNEDDNSYSSFYEQFNLDYATGLFQAGGRFEVYRTSVSNRSLTFLSQRYVSWSNGPAYVTAGNFQGILGRGLTLRAFELPGVILENTVFRRRHTNTSDMEGAFGSWTHDRFELKALAGRPVAGDIPPGFPDTLSTLDRWLGRGGDRRQDWVAGGELNVNLNNSTRIGGTVVNLRPRRSDHTYAWSGFVGLDLTTAFNRLGSTTAYGEVYIEISKREGFAEGGHGRYVSGSFGVGAFGISVEYKDYDNFNLLANDPPQLVREHSAYLLNRATHVLEAFNEKGYQVEAVFPIAGVGTITGNVSYGKNTLFGGLTTVFDERFVSLDFDVLPPEHTASVFFDWGKDELDGRSARRTGGVLIGTSALHDQTFELDLQLQHGRLPLDGEPKYWDSYGAISWRSPGGLGIALTVDRSTDPLETDVSRTFDIVETDPVVFGSVNLSGRLGPHEALLFLGERRGGTACTSGTCYEVLAFRGAELRLITRF